MAIGTDGGLLDVRPPQSYFKHQLLRHYVVPFSGMVGSASSNHRVVFLDGYAGSGRYENGDPGSAELAMKVAAGFKRIRIESIMVEHNVEHFRQLEKVALEYSASGVPVTVKRGKLERHINSVIEYSDGLPLFMFLDPTGATMPFGKLVDLLIGPRGARWPPTELLMNFSADLTRRTAGQFLKPGGRHANYPTMDSVCGGTWWRELVELGYQLGGGNNFAMAAELVAQAYSRRLAEHTGMNPVAIPVTARDGLQPIYHLIFMTRSKHGLWAMSDAIAKARRDWLLAPYSNEDAGLFATNDVIRSQLNHEQTHFQEVISANLLRVLKRPQGAFRLLDSVNRVLDSAFGIVTEQTVERAARSLEECGDIEIPNRTSQRVKYWAIQRPRQQPAGS